MNILKRKFYEVAQSVVPIVIVVLLLSVLFVPLESQVLIRFIVGALFVIFGLGFFLFGADMGIRQIGNHLGKALARSESRTIVGVMGFVLGFMITYAEPDLHILANEISSVSKGVMNATVMVLVVSLGVGIMVSIGLLRILKSRKINRYFIAVYGIIFILGLYVSESFLAFSFDASGATTGAMTTPFILALAYGVSHLKGRGDAEKDSFGLVGLASAGPIFMVMILSILKGMYHIEGELVSPIASDAILKPFLILLPRSLKDSIISLIPIYGLFLTYNVRKIKLSRRQGVRIFLGVIYTVIGLTLFMTGVHAGFMDAGRILGIGIATTQSRAVLLLIGFVIGTVVVLAEPAVYVLTEQVESVTSGSIHKRQILFSLSIGIGIAVMLAMLRIVVPGLKLWHFLLPGFALALSLSLFVPDLFVGIAFDSGGVASGPMTATFVLAFAQGVAQAVPTADVMIEGFGIIAIVAMMPIVTIQLLGLKYKLTLKKEKEVILHEI